MLSHYGVLGRSVFIVCVCVCVTGEVQSEEAAGRHRFTQPASSGSRAPRQQTTEQRTDSDSLV